MLASEGYIAKKRAREIREIKEFREFLIIPLSHYPIIPLSHRHISQQKNRVESNFQPYYHYRYAT